MMMTADSGAFPRPSITQSSLSMVSISTIQGILSNGSCIAQLLAALGVFFFRPALALVDIIEFNLPDDDED